MLGYRMLRQVIFNIGARLKGEPGGHMKVDHKPAVIPQDTERFKLLFSNSRLKMDPNYSAPLDFKPTRTLIRERIESAS